MKRSATAPKRQLSLPLLDEPITTVAAGDQKELTVALMELLIHAAQGELKIQPAGGNNEPPKAHA